MAEQFDMFSEQAPPDQVVTRSSSKSAKPDTHVIPMSAEDMVRHLSETGRYRIVQKLMPLMARNSSEAFEARVGPQRNRATNSLSGVLKRLGK
ncbi:hypothetical protein AB4Z52_30545 [Rhizobium sp. 2YAF20]|uniref:hypothetical protein n=1 Tax=Rhizobium sp. 2YAF20 TaxID=3233027 RepID=UPI003F9711C1